MAGLTGFDTALRHEVRRRGIRVIDLRPPHTETGLAARPIAGTAPHLGQGLEPQAVAKAIVAAIQDDRSEVPTSDFG